MSDNDEQTDITLREEIEEAFEESLKDFEYLYHMLAQ